MDSVLVLQGVGATAEELDSRQNAYVLRKASCLKLTYDKALQGTTFSKTAAFYNYIQNFHAPILIQWGLYLRT